MTDTPRSLEDMLDLLADNNTNAIRAQTLRDLAVSIANPIPGDGFLGANLTDSMFAANCAASVTLVNGGASYGTTKVAPYGTNRPGGTELHRGRELLSDSYTLDGSDPTSAYGVDVDAGNAFLLEPGAWHAVSYLIISGGVTFSATIFPPALCYVDQVAWDPDFSGPYDGSVPWMWAGFYNPVFATTPMDMIYVKDCANVLVAALTHDFDRMKIIEAGSAVPTTVKEIVTKVYEHAGYKEPLIDWQPMRPGEDEKAVVLADPQTMIDELNIHPKGFVDLDHGIVRTLDWYRFNG